MSNFSKFEFARIYAGEMWVLRELKTGTIAREWVMLDQVYEELKTMGCVRNHAEFSTRFLGRSERHFDYLRCTRSPASIETLTYLAAHLRAAATALEEAVTWPDEARQMKGLVENVWREVARRSSITRRPSTNPLRASLRVL